jgi:hypothetical protein
LVDNDALSAKSSDVVHRSDQGTQDTSIALGLARKPVSATGDVALPGESDDAVPVE